MHAAASECPAAPLLLATLSLGVISFCPGKFLIKAAFLNEIPLKEMKKNEQSTGSSAPLPPALTRAARFHDDKLTTANFHRRRIRPWAAACCPHLGDIAVPTHPQLRASPKVQCWHVAPPAPPLVADPNASIGQEEGWEVSAECSPCTSLPLQTAEGPGGGRLHAEPQPAACGAVGCTAVGLNSPQQTDRPGRRVKVCCCAHSN